MIIPVTNAVLEDVVWNNGLIRKDMLITLVDIGIENISYII